MPSHPFVVGICGLAGAGKSTYAAAIKQCLHRQHSLNAEIVPFAAPLKRGLSEMGIEKSAHPALYREAAQILGTNIVRRHSDRWWCDLFRRTVETTPVCQVLGGSLSDPGHKMIRRDVIIADDVRFMNEVSTIQTLGGVVLYVDAACRLGIVRRSIWTGSPRGVKPRGIYKHKSEALAVEIARDLIHAGHPPRFVDEVLSGDIEMPNDAMACSSGYVLLPECQSTCVHIARRCRAMRKGS
jgi:hypothetical protein